MRSDQRKKESYQQIFLNICVTILAAYSSFHILDNESIVLHFLFCLLFVPYIYTAKHLGQDISYPVLLASLTLFMSLFGVIIAIITLLLIPIFSRYSESEEVLYEEIFPVFQMDYIEKLNDKYEESNKRVFHSHGAQSFFEILNFGTLAEKRGAIERILRYYDPQYASILKAGLSNANSGIRVLSATALMTLDKQFADKAMRLKEEVRKDPDNFSLHLSYAVHLDKYANTKILGHEGLMKIGKQAISEYEKLEEKFPDNEQIKIALARLYSLIKDYDKVVGSFYKEVKEGSSLGVAVRSFVYDALFNLKQFATLSELFTFVKDEDFDERTILWKGLQ